MIQVWSILTWKNQPAKSHTCVKNCPVHMRCRDFPFVENKENCKERERERKKHQLQREKLHQQMKSKKGDVRISHPHWLTDDLWLPGALQKHYSSERFTAQMVTAEKEELEYNITTIQSHPFMYLNLQTHLRKWVTTCVIRSMQQILSVGCWKGHLLILDIYAWTTWHSVPLPASKNRNLFFFFFKYINLHKSMRGALIISPQACPPSPWWEVVEGSSRCSSSTSSRLMFQHRVYPCTFCTDKREQITGQECISRVIGLCAGKI